VPVLALAAAPFCTEVTIVPAQCCRYNQVNARIIGEDRSDLPGALNADYADVIRSHRRSRLRRSFALSQGQSGYPDTVSDRRP